MKHRFRFFLSPATLAPLRVDAAVLLSGTEHQHLAQVLRLSEGTHVDLCDGQGTEAEAEIQAVGSKQTTLRIISSHFTPPPPAPLIAAIGALKPGFIDELLPSLTELGCDQLHVFLQSNTNTRKSAAALAEHCPGGEQTM
jgi:RsmE family RNA methyltransferase